MFYIWKNKKLNNFLIYVKNLKYQLKWNGKSIFYIYIRYHHNFRLLIYSNHHLKKEKEKKIEEACFGGVCEENEKSAHGIKVWTIKFYMLGLRNGP